jgi:hypothetical protein
MTPQARDERGSITALAVGLVTVFVLLGALVVDGALMVRTVTRSADHAENAARAGAQEIDLSADGTLRLDPQRATARAQSYLDAHGLAGSVTVGELTVSVTVRTATRVRMLHLVGVRDRPVVATRTALATDH